MLVAAQMCGVVVRTAAVMLPLASAVAGSTNRPTSPGWPCRCKQARRHVRIKPLGRCALGLSLLAQRHGRQACLFCVQTTHPVALWAM